MRLTRTCVALGTVLSLSAWSLAGSADLAWIHGQGNRITKVD